MSVPMRKRYEFLVKESEPLAPILLSMFSKWLLRNFRIHSFRNRLTKNREILDDEKSVRKTDNRRIQ
jgi:hypothetical protein